jgi:CRP/FNR family transcriptional regulator, cyclic AMP receptor protein
LKTLELLGSGVGIRLAFRTGMSQSRKNINGLGVLTISATTAARPVSHGSSVAPTKAASPFANLRGEARGRFNSIQNEISCERGDRLFLEGEEPDRVFILLAGRVKLSVNSREGKTVMLRIAGEGQCLGVSAALSGNQHEVSAEVLEPCRAHLIHAADFLAFLEDYPEAALEATRSILAEYQATFSSVCRLALPATVAGRLANLLLEWRDHRMERGAEGQRLTVALTHGEIAELTATSRETISRVFQQFQREKLIAVKGASVTVLQPQALEQLAW